MSTSTFCEITLRTVPCQVGDADLWFAEKPVDLARAKALCAGCPIRRECLAAALQRQEPWGVWGGEIIESGKIIAGKRPRGRPRKHPEDRPQPEGRRGFRISTATFRRPRLRDGEVL